ncbi:uncharacterized protein LOC111031529 [Myzus persicae]|uniref:uncharacterized protein LOC111031529 n=1 Tax=Myzus persicae TaxID=13164 RepID=UPI000B93155A|nr:uncharacterized protein LOC111031529 [Myzus persicae]
MNVKIAIALFAVVTVLQLSHCKPTHRIVRETNDEDEGRTNKIKEFFGQFYGGSKPQSQSPSTPTYQQGSSSPYQPDSSNQPDSSTSYKPELLTSSVEETPAGIEDKD